MSSYPVIIWIHKRYTEHLLLTFYIYYAEVAEQRDLPSPINMEFLSVGKEQSSGGPLTAGNLLLDVMSSAKLKSIIHTRRSQLTKSLNVLKTHHDSGFEEPIITKKFEATKVLWEQLDNSMDIRTAKDDISAENLSEQLQKDEGYGTEFENAEKQYHTFFNSFFKEIKTNELLQESYENSDRNTVTRGTAVIFANLYSSG